VIQVAPQMRILVAIDPVDLRKGIDGLAQLCREKLGADPFSGYLFIFRSRRATAIKVLAYDGQGFWMAQKRLSKGRFVWWPTGKEATRTLHAGSPGAVALGRGEPGSCRSSAGVAARKLKKHLRSKKISFTLRLSWTAGGSIADA